MQINHPQLIIIVLIMAAFLVNPLSASVLAPADNVDPQSASRSSPATSIAESAPPEGFDVGINLMQMHVAVLAGSWVCTDKLPDVNPSTLEVGDDSEITDFTNQISELVSHMKTPEGRAPVYEKLNTIRTHILEKVKDQSTAGSEATVQDQNTADDLMVILLATNQMPSIHGGCMPIRGIKGVWTTRSWESNTIMTRLKQYPTEFADAPADLSPIISKLAQINSATTYAG